MQNPGEIATFVFNHRRHPSTLSADPEEQQLAFDWADYSARARNRRDAAYDGEQRVLADEVALGVYTSTLVRMAYQRVHTRAEKLASIAKARSIS